MFARFVHRKPPALIVDQQHGFSNVNKIFIIKTLGKISAVWYNRRYINEFGKAGLINESCCYGYR